MPWGRLDDQANGNAKLLALSDPAWRLWGCGLIYCQANLTDGFIPDYAIFAFGVRATDKCAVAEELCQSLVPGKRPLWHRVDGGYQVHDYLDWNDSRTDILKDRERGKQRQQAYRDRRKGNGERDALQGALHDAVQTPVHVPLPLTSAEERRSDPDAKRSPISELLTRYIERYVQVVGTKPHIQRPKDPKLLADLLKQHDEATVLAAMEAMFNEPDEFVQRHGYSIGIFKSQFNGFLVKSRGLQARAPRAAVRSAPSKSAAAYLRKAGILK